MALLSRAAVLAHLDGFDASEDGTALDGLIADAEAMIHRLLYWPAPDSGARVLSPSTYTLYLDGPDRDRPAELALGLRPVISVTSIHDDTDWAYGSGTLVDSSQYTLDAQRGRVLLLPAATHAWSASRRALKVVVSAGYVAADVPDLVAALALQVAHMWPMRSVEGVPDADDAGGAAGAATAALLDGGATPKRVRDLIAPFRLWGRAVA